MKMEFIFDEEKIKNLGYTKEFCFKELEKHFNKFKSNTLKKISNGIYEGTDDDFSAFASTCGFTSTSWFLKVIKEWYWYVDEEDGKGLQKGNFLETYYEVNEMLNGSVMV